MSEEQQPHQCLARRRAGVLLHITSLPGPGATGSLGPEAFRFTDFLVAGGFSIWQMLPIGPTGDDGSPYQTNSAHAGEPRLIDLQPIVERGWLEPEALTHATLGDEQKHQLLLTAWANFNAVASPEQREELAAFVNLQGYWLHAYALYRAIHDEHQGRGWWDWPAPLRNREPEALAQARSRLRQDIEFIAFEQFLFFDQWAALKRYANERGVQLFGDMPIFVAHDSAEVWAQQDLFHLDQHGHPTVVAGVPPDYFSDTGQRWGNPLYDWDRLQETGFSFWEQRIKTQLQVFDLIRIDHFRGFEAYWEIPAADDHAMNGQWVQAPGDALFAHLHRIYDPLPLVAEDLGVITDEVDALRRKYRLPGMKILQFAFSGDPDNPYLPFNHEPDSVVYTGTHDNDTSLGWYASLDDHFRGLVDEFLGRPGEAMPLPLIRTALASCARLAVIPMQDLLGLDGNHRMNLPGTVDGNWRWRFTWDQADPELAARLHRRNQIYARLST